MRFFPFTGVRVSASPDPTTSSSKWPRGQPKTFTRTSAEISLRSRLDARRGNVVLDNVNPTHSTATVHVPAETYSSTNQIIVQPIDDNGNITRMTMPNGAELSYMVCYFPDEEIEQELNKELYLFESHPRPEPTEALKDDDKSLRHRSNAWPVLDTVKPEVWKEQSGCRTVLFISTRTQDSYQGLLSSTNPMITEDERQRIRNAQPGSNLDFNLSLDWSAVIGNPEYTVQEFKVRKVGEVMGESGGGPAHHSFQPSSIGSRNELGDGTSVGIWTTFDYKY